MKRNIIYVALALIVGLFLGYVLFGTSEVTVETHDDHEHLFEATSNEMWTCAMHPQIMKTESGDCPICGMDLIPVQTDGSGLTAQQFKLTENAEALANITTSVVGESETDQQHLKLSGTIQVNADKQFILPAHYNGRIEKLYVTSLGQKVNKGQLVAVVYSPELINAQQELITAYKIKESQPELYRAVRNKFKNWMIHDAQLNAIERSGAVMTPFKIYSHVSGTVSEISVKEGDHIMDGKAIFKVSNLSTVWAEFDAYEHQINRLKVGQIIDISANAYPNKTIQSKITFIDPILSGTTRTVTVRAVLQNKDDLLKPGMFIEGSVFSVSENKENTMLNIPETAVMWTGKRSVVYLKVNANESVFEMREIVLGDKTGDTYNVVNGLAAGDVIVTHGAFTVDAAAQLQGKASMMNQNKLSNSVTNTVVSEQILEEGFKAVPEAFQNEIETVFYSYITLKNSLVASNLESARAQSNLLLKSLREVDTKSISNDVKMSSDWTVISDKIKKDVTEMQTLNTIELFRSVFSRVSLDLKQGIEKYGIQPKVYVQFCPMANQNLGGYWLSLNEIIENPYFGNVMLSCGENDKLLH
ncbi:efflux RND transporter periplasmic adaptor subunit [uncultured Formosa sp.]|uniref:efflux RND transporter periplasmic adaptor subunit n=1 Tax=uncultured Formosa sp. TaxID=255435 RepID=UPI00263697AE|nr:efflux RND transporter periplasmic adaptor subunit [uncultured Formosa sp.]